MACRTWEKRNTPGVLLVRTAVLQRKPLAASLKPGQDLPGDFTVSRALQELRRLALMRGMPRRIRGHALEVGLEMRMFPRAARAQRQGAGVCQRWGRAGDEQGPGTSGGDAE